MCLGAVWSVRIFASGVWIELRGGFILTDTIYMTVELPETTDPIAVQDLAATFEALVGELEEVSEPEVDVEEVSRSLGIVNPAVLISFLGQAAAVAGSVTAIVKAISATRDLLKAKSQSEKLSPAQKLLLTLDLENVYVKINGVSVPVLELAEKDSG